MTDSTKCPQCGGELPASFPPGICPACLLQQGLSPSTQHAEQASRPGSSADSRHRWTPPTPAELAPRFPQLEITELLGHGGMGAVYKVRQKDLDRWAALKILPDEVAGDPGFAERFQREARALAQLGHPHIVTVYEFGQRDGVYFLLMEYVDGVTLRQAIRGGQISAADALGIVTQICDALQFAHEEGVVHRDIKPENILVDKRGRVKIADFGLAKLLGQTPGVPTLTGTRQVMGTPVYMAPEQMEGTRAVDHRADIFSLGVVFYELLTGELPVGRFAPPSQKYSLDIRLDEVVLRTLEKEPDRRYQHASQVRADVETIRNHPAAAAAGTRRDTRRTFFWPRSRFAQLALILLVGLPLLCIAVPAWVWQTIGNIGEFVADRMDHRAVDNLAVDMSEKQAAIDRHLAELERTRQAHAQQKKVKVKEQFRPGEDAALVTIAADGVMLHPPAFAELSPQQRATVDKILTEIHRKYVTLEARHSRAEATGDLRQVTIEPFADDVRRLENELWTAIDTQLPVDVQTLLRKRLPLYADPTVTLPPASGPPIDGSEQILPAQLQSPQVLGWQQARLPLRLTIRRKGKWFQWEIGSGVRKTLPGGEAVIEEFPAAESGEAPELPPGLRRFWRETDAARTQRPVESPAVSTPPAAPADDLTARLLEMDRLRAGAQTPWTLVEKQTSELLAKFPSLEDRGRIHWQAAHVYGQSDIRGHAADVIRHAQEALKFERDPVQRGWLFMHLGCAAESLDSQPANFVERRAAATRWYFKGYRELLPYNLPENAPEPPPVGRISRELFEHGQGVDPQRTAAEVIRAAEIKVRKDAEFIRDLVHRRGVYIGRLQDLYGRLHSLYDADSDARGALRAIATEVFEGETLPDGTSVVDDILRRVWPVVMPSVPEE